jgi:hypothetical protein
VTRHPADSRDLPLTGRAPTSEPVARVVDVLLVTTGNDGGSFEDFEAHPPVGEPAVELGRGLTITALEPELAELIMDSCELRGHYFHAKRQYGCRYAFVLDRPLTDAYETRWDPDGAINAAVALSRLVRDNAYSTEYVARVTEHADGERKVVPFDLQESRYSYRLGVGRDWLDDADAQALAALLKVYWEVEHQFPPRLRGALWRCEHLAHERWLDIALPGFAAALDGLVNTSHDQVTRQFVDRVHALGAELDVEGTSKNFCRKMYAARSQGLHGFNIDLLTASRQEEAVQKTGRLQAVLRSAVRRGLEDPAFRAAFETDETVRSRWPVQVKRRRCLRTHYDYL